MSSVRLALLVCVVAVPACLPASDPASDPATSQTEQAILPVPDPCDGPNCGGVNGPVMNGLPFSDIASDGTPNSAGLAIAGVFRASDNTPMKLIAINDMLLGIDPWTGLTLAAGIDLIGTRIITTLKGKPYEITISYVSPTGVIDERFWVGSYDRVEAYEFMYKPVGSVEHPKPLCTYDSTDPSSASVRAIAFTGDRYDPDSKAVTVGPKTDGWINIACKFGAPYKLHLLGHTTAATARIGIYAPVAKRRTLLLAVSMTACGAGESFTVQGTHITLSESQNLLPAASPFQLPPALYEAIWTTDGVRCMNWHRRAKSAEDYKVIRANIESTCGRVIPECKATDFGMWKTVGSVITGVP
jgi:hypothetical protein